MFSGFFPLTLNPRRIVDILCELKLYLFVAATFLVRAHLILSISKVIFAR